MGALLHYLQSNVFNMDDGTQFYNCCTKVYSTALSIAALHCNTLDLQVSVAPSQLTISLSLFIIWDRGMIMVSNVRQLELISYLRIDACSYRCDDIGCARSIHCLQQIKGA